MKTEPRLAVVVPLNADLTPLQIDTLTNMATATRVLELLAEDCEERKDEPPNSN